MQFPQILFVFVCSAFMQAKGWAPQQRQSSTFGRRSTTNLGAASNNVVLRPSESPSFDSYKIGGAKVHRYSRDTDPESETEYVMWYHGRSKELDSDKSLPPLSTGRIGRATSKNGLHWVKTEQGSASEDASDVSLGLNKESWWGFDTAHVGLGSVLLPMRTPKVLTDGGVYLLYFFGGNLEETPIVDYLDSDNIPEAMEKESIKGMKMKIGVALSQDGLTWGRIEGDDPSGACITVTDFSDPNQDDGGAFLNLQEELYCGWPEVVVRIPQDERKSEDENAFFMYYSTMLKATKQKSIAYAVSADGFRWLKRGVCLMPDIDGNDAGGCARCTVRKDAVFDEDSCSWKETDTWKMYYEGVGEDNNHRILMAVSADGREFQKEGVVFDVGADGEWDCGGVGSPHFVRMDDGTERMYYTGQDSDGKTAIGVAKLSESGPNEWVREQATVTFA